MLKQTSKNASPHPWMMVFTLILGVYQILFAYRVLFHNGVDSDLLAFSPLLQAGIAICWAGLFGYAAYRQWCKLPNAMRFSAWLLIFYIISRLVLANVFVQADYNHNRFGFLIVLTLMILIVPISVLWQTRKRGTHS